MATYATNVTLRARLVTSPPCYVHLAPKKLIDRHSYLTIGVSQHAILGISETMLIKYVSSANPHARPATSQSTNARLVSPGITCIEELVENSAQSTTSSIMLLLGNATDAPTIAKRARELSTNVLRVNQDLN